MTIIFFNFFQLIFLHFLFVCCHSRFYSELISCHPVSVKNGGTSEGHKSKRAQHYIELCLNVQDAVKRPRVRCSNEEMAQRAARHVSSYSVHTRLLV